MRTRLTTPTTMPSTTHTDDVSAPLSRLERADRTPYRAACLAVERALRGGCRGLARAWDDAGRPPLEVTVEHGGRVERWTVRAVVTGPHFEGGWKHYEIATTATRDDALALRWHAQHGRRLAAQEVG